MSAPNKLSAGPHFLPEDVDGHELTGHFIDLLKKYDISVEDVWCIFGLENSTFPEDDDFVVEVTHPLKPNKEKVLAMLLVACIMRENLQDLVTEMLEAVLRRLKVVLPEDEDEDEDVDEDVDEDEDEDEDRNLLPYLEQDDSLEGVTVDQLRFTEPGDTETFDHKTLFFPKEWRTIKEYLLLLFQNPGKCRTHNLIRILKKYLVVNTSSRKRLAEDLLESDTKRLSP